MLKKLIIPFIAIVAIFVSSVDISYAEENTPEVNFEVVEQEDLDLIVFAPPRTITVNNQRRPDYYDSHTAVPSTWLHTIFSDGMQYRGTLRLQRTERDNYGRWVGYYSGTLTGRPLP